MGEELEVGAKSERPGRSRSPWPSQRRGLFKGLGPWGLDHVEDGTVGVTLMGAPRAEVRPGDRPGQVHTEAPPGGAGEWGVGSRELWPCGVCGAAGGGPQSPTRTGC